MTTQTSSSLRGRRNPTCGIAFPSSEPSFVGAHHRASSPWNQRVPLADARPVRVRFGDTSHLTPLTKMYTLDHRLSRQGSTRVVFRYHGMSPLVSHTMALGLIEARSYHQLACFEAGVSFREDGGHRPGTRVEPRHTRSHRRALRCKSEGKGQTIVFNLRAMVTSTMQSYTDYFAGKLTDQPYDDAAARVFAISAAKTPAEYA